MRFVKFNKKTCYAIKIMVDLASQPDRALVSSQKIAERRKIPKRFMAQITSCLAKEGFLSSTRGSKGGIVISCDPAEVCIADFVEKLESPLVLNPCVLGREKCEAKKGCFIEGVKCPIRSAWVRAQREMLSALESTTLEDLVNLERETALEYQDVLLKK